MTALHVFAIFTIAAVAFAKWIEDDDPVAFWIGLAVAGVGLGVAFG